MDDCSGPGYREVDSATGTGRDSYIEAERRICPSTVCATFDKIVEWSAGVWSVTPVLSLVVVRSSAMYDNGIGPVCYVWSCDELGTVMRPVDFHLSR